MLDPIDWSLSPPTFAAALLLGYLIGSVPFGLLLTRVTGAGDLRAIGSGSIGATNVLRTGNKPLAALTLAADMLKGTVPVLVGLNWGTDTAILAGLGAFLGHLFPIWLKFKGGKGVATYIGVLLGLFWKAALMFCALWLIIAFLFRYSSLAALIACAATPFVLALMSQWQTMALFIALTVLVFIRHESNIGRLLRGEEFKL